MEDMAEGAVLVKWPFADLWDGALPYTMLVDPDGKVIYGKQGIINPEELKKIIWDDPTMGRIYK